jgi:putative endonuclease
MTQERLHFGKEGEKAAVKFLKKRGYRIIEKNYRNKSGEIDIVAEQDQVLVFVEVKSRTDGKYGEPLEAVTPHKQRKIGQVAKGFMVQHRIQNRDCRFDVVGIRGDPSQSKTWEIELVPDAFRL